MKKNVIKIMCSLLALTLLFGQTVSFISANNTISNDSETMGIDTDNQENTDTAVDVGRNVLVYVMDTLGFEQDIPVKVSLNGEEGILDSSTDDNKWFKFKEVPQGTYELEITGPGFVKYTQTVEVSIYDLKLVISTGKVEEEAYGMMLYGDVNRDGSIDFNDTNAIIDAMEGNSDLPQSQCDVDLNGEVNLVDLQYVATRIGLEQRDAFIEKKINKGAISVSEDDENTVVVSTDNRYTIKPNNDEVISETNPITFSMELGNDESAVVDTVTVKTGENQINGGSVTVFYLENGVEKKIELPLVDGSVRTFSSGPAAIVQPDGSIVINLGGQIAVKKVTFKITSTTNKDANLVEISEVEFVNNMEDKIPAPDLNIPSVKTVTAGNAEIYVSWDKERNVTGYEISISNGGATQYLFTASTEMTITQFLNKKLENKKEYTIAVRSINGDWKSDFSESYTVIPKATTKPDKPDSLKLKGVFKGIEASWNAPKDNAADYYTLYYKKRSDADFKKVSNITSTKYTVENLEENVEYEMYVTASNEYGESGPSTHSIGKPASTRVVEFSNYHLINTSNGKGEITDHIVSATKRNGDNVYMVNSPLDEGNPTSALGLVDNDQNSYYEHWDWDDANNYHPDWGLTFQLDKAYKMDTFVFTSPDNNMDFTGAAIYYWENGNRVRAKNVTLTRKQDKNGNRYFRVKLAEPITSDKIKLGLSRYTSPIRVSEVKFYEYDSLEDDIENLYTDTMHLTIKDDIKQEDLDKLQERLNTTHQGDYHPDREALQKELNEAIQLFNEQSLLNSVQYVKSSISSNYDSQLSTGGLNAWQPLGISAKAGDQIIIYVGKENAAGGAKTNLQLIATQQHANSDEMWKVISDLKVGRNVIDIPSLTSEDVEKGGALYIQYTGDNQNEKYAYRVNGGHKIPVLDLYKVNEEERQARIKAYVEELKTYVADLEKNHNEDHATKILFFTLNGYNEKECIYNTTDIMLDHMMLSIPASQVLAGIQNNPEKILNATVDSMNEMMTLFYQSKGLTDKFAEGTSDDVKNKNRMPSQHLNIRYMQMFSGAFMYASGNHIGIEWDQTKGLMLNQKPVVSEDGKLLEGQYFGWGIAHEIGHQLNQSQYTIAEVTNNYYSLLAQANGSNNGVRFAYSDVYKKVTSNTKGYPSDVFTQLAMYWQLRLAYDNHYAQKAFNDYNDIFDNLLYARIDSYARNTALFKGEVPLVLTGDVDQNFMRLASAAANKDLTEFFTRWGYTPNEDTKTFMNQFDKETRAIYYINDDAKSAVIEGETQPFQAQAVIENINVNVENSEVTLTMKPKEAYANDILGYEVVRVTRNKSQTKKEIVGFTTSNKFTDAINLGSRVVSYEVRAVDKHTNYSSVSKTEDYKIMSDGAYDKSQMTVTTNMESEMDTVQTPDENMPCSPVKNPAINMILDGNKTETYIGKTEDGNNPYILIDLRETLEVSGIRYYADESAISDYKIEVSKDGKEYITVREGEFELENNQQTVYFTNNKDPWIATYDARYIKITAVNSSKKDIGVTEIDIIGPTGDNIEFYRDGTTPAIGKLTSDFIYQEGNSTQEELKIPEGSIIFTGNYKGNPAYNVVVLYDENGNIVGGTNDNGELVSQQIILAPDPGNALLGETSEGIWIYWIEPEHQTQFPKQVRAELYRVDNALTNAGERLVSDTLLIDVPSELPPISLEK